MLPFQSGCEVISQSVCLHPVLPIPQEWVGTLGSVGKSHSGNFLSAAASGLTRNQLGAAVGGAHPATLALREEAPWPGSEIETPLGSLKGAFLVLNGPAVPERGNTAIFLE